MAATSSGGDTENREEPPDVARIRQVVRQLRTIYNGNQQMHELGEAYVDARERSDNLSKNRDKVSATSHAVVRNAAEFETRIRDALRLLNEASEIRDNETAVAPKSRHEVMSVLADQGNRLPLWIPPLHGQPGPLVGAIPANDAYKLSFGDYCAAYAEQIWMLGEVRGIADNGRYNVRDVDDSEKPMTILARRRLIPLPKWRACPQHIPHALFPRNAEVLALYPQTTVFYKGVVVESPARATDCYKIAFEDDQHPGQYARPLEVHQKYVLHYRDVAYKPRESNGGEENGRGTSPAKFMVKEKNTGGKEVVNEKSRGRGKYAGGEDSVDPSSTKSTIRDQSVPTISSKSAGNGMKKADGRRDKSEDIKRATSIVSKPTKEEKELIRESIREARKDEKKQERLRRKEAKRAERERIKQAKKEEKQRLKAIKRDLKRKEKNLRAKERYHQKKKEEKERMEKEAEEKGEGSGETEEKEEGEEVEQQNDLDDSRENENDEEVEDDSDGEDEVEEEGEGEEEEEEEGGEEEEENEVESDSSEEEM